MVLHRACLTAVLAVLLVPAAASAAPVARSTLVDCRTGDLAEDRAAEFRGMMRSVAGAVKLQMRFVLRSAALGDNRWRKVQADGFGTWTTADPGVGRYEYLRRVQGLPAGARYRVTVSYRWLSATGKVLRFERDRSPQCKQPDLRPNLLAGVIGVEPSEGDGGAVYRIPVHNTGPTAAGAFEVVLTVNGERRPAEAIAGLAPGERRYLTLMGPRCEPGTEITVELDTAHTVDERDEDDNLAGLSCA